MRVAGAQFKTITHAAGLSSTGDPECSVANYTRRFEGLASRSIVGNRVMEAVPVTGIPPWDRGMGQGEMRIFRFDLGQPVRVSKHKPRKSRNAVGQVGKPWGSFSPPILAIVPAVPARPCMRGGTGTGIRPHLFLTRVLWRAKN